MRLLGKTTAKDELTMENYKPHEEPTTTEVGGESGHIIMENGYSTY